MPSVSQIKVYKQINAESLKATDFNNSSESWAGNWGTSQVIENEEYRKAV